MLGNSRSSLASCSRNFYCIILLASSHTTLVTPVSHNFWVYLYYYAMHEFCFSSFSHQVASTKWVENMKNLPHLFVCLTLKVIDLLGNPVVDSRITTHYTVFPFFSTLCIISGKWQASAKIFPSLNITICFCNPPLKRQKKIIFKSVFHELTCLQKNNF